LWGFDSTGFADIDVAVTLSCSLAAYYPLGHAMRAKWNLGNVDALWFSTPPDDPGQTYPRG